MKTGLALDDYKRVQVYKTMGRLFSDMWYWNNFEILSAESVVSGGERLNELIYFDLKHCAN